MAFEFDEPTAYDAGMVVINTSIYEALMREWQETTVEEQEDFLGRWLVVIEKLDESGDTASRRGMSAATPTL